MAAFKDIESAIRTYINKRGGEASDVDKIKNLIQPGINPKIVGFLLLKIKNSSLTSENFLESFDDTELSELSLILRERKKNPDKKKTLDPHIRQSLLETLYRYATAFGFIREVKGKKVARR